MVLESKRVLQHPVKFNSDMMQRGESINHALFISMYGNVRNTELKIERLAHQINEISKSKGTISEEQRELSKSLNQEKKELENGLEKKREEFNDFLYSLPNWLDENVPAGKNSDDNIEIYRSPIPIKENSEHHEDIALALGLWGRKEAVNMSGSRFIVLKDKLAKLERTLAQFVINYLTNSGFLELSVPFLVKKGSMYNTGQLPKFSGEYFESDDFCLISTGEIPLVNYFANEVLKQLPAKVVACTPCFRKEAGSLGKDTKGLIRLHQFTKVEMVCLTEEEKSKEMHLEMLEHVKSILDLLKLHYRVVEVCSGDMGFTAARQFDVEVWMPSQKAYVEVASCSNCMDFQSRRMKTKYISTDGSKKFVHTLNCTGLACGRITAAILENYCSSSEFRIPVCLNELFEVL